MNQSVGGLKPVTDVFLCLTLNALIIFQRWWSVKFFYNMLVMFKILVFYEMLIYFHAVIVNAKTTAIKIIVTSETYKCIYIQLYVIFYTLWYYIQFQRKKPAANTQKPNGPTLIP